jgi:prepilin-type N-terminal cleavage/methylation domain-containing protein
MENKQDKGFTLVELLIVIVILGILATVTVLAVSGITDKAKENTCTADGATLQTAYESAYVQNGAVVPTLAELQAALSDNNSTKVAASAGAGVWGYSAGTLTAPTDAPATCDDITLS